MLKINESSGKDIKFELILLLIFIVVSLVYNYIYIAQFGPSSVHSWRQSDSASVAMNYYHNGLSFFNPKVHALVSGDSAAASEFPITYYIAAIFYSVFGPYDYILRILDLLIYYIGIYYLAKLLREYFQGNLLIVFAIILMFLGTPLLAFYSFNFIPNPPALGFLFSAAYYYYNYRFKKTDSHFFPMIILFALAGLIKPTMLILFLSIAIVEFIATFLRIDKRFTPKKLFIFFAGVIIPVGLWIMWVKYYNESHNSGLFSTEVVPFTMLDKKQLSFALHNISTGFDQRIFQYTIMKALFAIIIFNLIYFLKKFDLLSIFFFIFFVGNVSYLLLWMKRFTVHDYYSIDLFPFYIFNIVFFFKLVLDIIKNKRLKTFIGVFALLLGIFNVYFAAEYIKMQFFNHDNVALDYPKSFYYNRKEFKDFLNKNNLAFDKTKIVVYPDDSPNICLYYFDIRGRNLPGGFDKFQYLVDLYNDNGIEYFIILDKKLRENDNLMQYLKYPVDSLNDEIFIYDIKRIARK